MKRIFDWMIKRWWLFPSVGVLCSLMLLLSIRHLPGGIWAWLLVGGLFGLSLLTIFLQVAIFIVSLVRKRWWIAWFTMVTGWVNLVVFTLFPLLMILMGLGSIFALEEDDFGRRHPIPEGMEYYEPLDDPDRKWNSTDGYIFTPLDIDSTDTSSWLQVWKCHQGGIYSYAFYWPALEDGEVYLRCFEATENIELSDNQIKRRTTTQVAGHNGFGQIVEPNHMEFTIYEGDWEEYYAVRVEVWHKPAKGKAHRLMQKVYRMEGWMR